jgi:hypothetical protein
MRQRHASVLRELATWSLAVGRPANLDLAALLLDLLLAQHGPFPWTIDRPDVEDVVHGLRADGAVAANFAIPEDRYERLFDLVMFLGETGRLDVGPVPLEVLLEPPRCAGGLGLTGSVLEPGSPDQEVRCQCLVRHDPTLPPGVQQHFLGSGHEGRRLAARGVVLRRSDDHLVSCLEPLREYLRRLRADESPWDLFGEELRYAGEVFPTKDSPALSAYRLVDDRRGGWAPLLLDRSGQPWAAKPHRGRKAGYRWVDLTLSEAISRAGIDRHILRARPLPPAYPWRV